MHRGYTCVWRKIWSNAALCEPGRRFSRLEAWLYITNFLAAGKDDAATGLKRGEFVASIRQLVDSFNWSQGAVQRFLDTLVQNSMIKRVVRQAVHQTIQGAGHFSICKYETYNSPRYAGRYTDRYAERDTYKEVFKESKRNINNTPLPADAGVCVSPKILVDIYQQHNQALPGVKAVTAERLRRCRSRINQAVRDGCLEQYLADFVAAVKKAQSTPFLRGEGARRWRASFDWFVTNHVNVYAVLEGKYDGPAMDPSKPKGGLRGNDRERLTGDAGAAFARRTSRGEPMYIPRQ
jgi:hypothetical protein